jgi:hydroxymethylpyrimidine pyrophosphatase-like HAD family hydrolase
VRALFRIGGGDRFVYAKGVGLGYMGDHSLAVARALEDRVPHVFGVRDGVLYREWLPEQERVSSHGPRGDAAHWLADYAARRSRALPVSRDTAAGLVLRGAVWHASKLIASAFGRGAILARVWAVIASRRLLRAERPSVIDGDLAPERWFVGENGNPVKVGFDVSTFDNSDSMELYCFDPAADIASAVASWGDVLDADELLRAYHDQGGAPISAARLALHELVYLTKARGGPDKMAHAVQRYLSRVVLSDVSAPSTGPVWAIDVDGVLETGELGFPASNPRACLALRALMAHGRRPVLATARSLADARERCRSYRVAGAIAEYGAVIYASTTDSTRSLVSESQTKEMDALRSVANGASDLHVTPGYATVIQAYRVDDRGRMRALESARVEELLAGAGVRDRVVVRSTRAHTDFIPLGIDKGTAVRPLLELLGQNGEHSDRPLEMALGDTRDDLPLFALATAAVAPAGSSELRGQGVRFASSGQGALVDAVARAIGHRPGGCEICRVAPPSAEDRILGLALDALGRGPSGKLRQAVRFAFAVNS